MFQKFCIFFLIDKNRKLKTFELQKCDKIFKQYAKPPRFFKVKNSSWKLESDLIALEERELKKKKVKQK